MCLFVDTKMSTFSEVGQHTSCTCIMYESEMELILYIPQEGERTSVSTLTRKTIIKVRQGNSVISMFCW